MDGNARKSLDKPFRTFDEQVALLRARGLIISHANYARQLLSTYSYYDLVNGYKECFMVTPDQFKDGTRIEDLQEFHLLDKGIQNVLFLYSTYVENTLKTALAYVIAKNIGADNRVYLDKHHYSDTNKLREVLEMMRGLCDVLSSRPDNPTKYYLKNHNHIPPWILFKNCTFSTCIDLSMHLNKKDRREVIDSILAIRVHDDYRVKFFKDALNTIRKFRNAIAHNLKFITFRIPERQRIVFRKMMLEYSGTLLFSDRDGGKRCLGDPFSMLVALTSFIQEPRLLDSLLIDLKQQILRFSKAKTFSLYCDTTGFPEDILYRFEIYVKKRSTLRRAPDIN